MARGVGVEGEGRECYGKKTRRVISCPEQCVATGDGSNTKELLHKSHPFQVKRDSIPDCLFCNVSMIRSFTCKVAELMFVFFFCYFVFFCSIMLLVGSLNKKTFNMLIS